jgi:phage/plasmid-associated DNA primase
MNTNIIAGKSGTNVDAQLIDGIGARIWSFNETYENAQLRSDTVKMISGRGIMTVKARGQTIEVSPHQTCIVTTNHLPRLGTVNEALKQRLICIEFPVTFKDLLAGEEETLLSRRRDTNLKSWFEVAENKTAFLKYLVDGSIEYQKRCGGDSGSGLKSHAPKAVLDFTEKYLYDHDIIQQFLDAKCDIGTDYKESATLLRTSYERYFNVKISYNCLKKLLEGKGHLSMQNCVPGGLNGYMGLRLKR